MKYCVSTLLITLITMLFCQPATANSSAALASSMQARWFEIEVILFKQNSVKREENETFTALKSTKNKNTIDLLSPYLQPDISSLKQLLPYCADTQTSSANTIIQLDQPNWSLNYQLHANQRRADSLPLELIAPNATPIRSMDSVPNDVAFEPNNLNQFSEQANYNQYPDLNQNTLCVVKPSVIASQLSADELTDFNIDGFPVGKLSSTVNGIEQWQADDSGQITWASNQPYLINENSLKLKSIAARLKRSRDYSSVFHLGWRQIGESKKAAKPFHLFAGENLYDDYLEQLAGQQLPSQQNPQRSNQPNQNKYNDTGQADLTVLEQQQLKQQHKKAQVEQLFSDLTTVNSALQKSLVALPIAEKSSTNAGKTRSTLNIESTGNPANSINANNIPPPELTSLPEASNSLENPLYSNEDINLIIDQLSANSLFTDASTLSENVNTNLSGQKTSNPVNITKPLQPWSIDGFFKVHLNRFLYINTEFTVIDPEYQTKQHALNKLNNAEFSEKNEVVTFKQSRKVITGEIHYFDHPYIGMIVQIRRFDPTKPADQAVTQAKRQ
jgi:hypothetical protein